MPTNTDVAISEAVLGVLCVTRFVASRTSLGGTAPQNARREARWAPAAREDGG